MTIKNINEIKSETTFTNKTLKNQKTLSNIQIKLKQYLMTIKNINEIKSKTTFTNKTLKTNNANKTLNTTEKKNHI